MNQQYNGSGKLMEKNTYSEQGCCAIVRGVGGGEEDDASRQTI